MLRKLSLNTNNAICTTSLSPITPVLQLLSLIIRQRRQKELKLFRIVNFYQQKKERSPQRFHWIQKRTEKLCFLDPSTHKVRAYRTENEKTTKEKKTGPAEKPVSSHSQSSAFFFGNKQKFFLQYTVEMRTSHLQRRGSMLRV